MAKPNIDQPFGDNPLLDILHIAYNDLRLGRLTERTKIERIMLQHYPHLNKVYLKRLIQIIIESNWFEKAINSKGIYVVNIEIPGIEAYLNMIQIREAKEHSIQADRKADFIIFLTIVVIILTAAAPILTEFLKAHYHF